MVSLPDLTAIRYTHSSIMLTTHRLRRSLSMTSFSSYQLEDMMMIGEGLTISSSSTVSSFFHSKEEMKDAVFKDDGGRLNKRTTTQEKESPTIEELLGTVTISDSALGQDS